MHLAARTERQYLAEAARCIEHEIDIIENRAVMHVDGPIAVQVAQGSIEQAGRDPPAVLDGQTRVSAADMEKSGIPLRTCPTDSCITPTD
jgi:hypothetical protein